MKFSSPYITCLLLLIGISLSSCVDEFDTNSNALKSNIFVFSELIAGESVELKVLKTSAFGESVNLDFPEDAVVIITGPSGSSRVLYDQEKGAYCEGLITVEEEVTYSIDITLPQTSLDDITATTKVPTLKGFETASVTKGLNSLNQLELNINLAFDPNNVSEYYQIVPYFYISDIISIGGVVDTVVGIERHYVNFGSLPRDDDHIGSLAHRDGVLISSDALLQGEISFKGIAGVSLADNQIVDQVYIETRSTDASFYNYHRQLSKQILLDQTNLGEPVLVSSNVENGYGLFGSYSKDTKTIIVH